ncbi:acyltransferase family protein [Enterovirga sp.]|uniref:acyltransferase family protein n=1 Tax=Enterovirga sp. TaxID=2026350 RepID=UPI00262FE428|nr:acyltransferase family protein [Enterovirga sp.]MDB5592137.1 acyltransferase 3 [Enterovirga sp.]
MEIVNIGRSAPTASGRAGAHVGPGQTQSGPAGNEPRIAWVDTAKGICIILVVMMHATLGVEAEMGREGFMHAAVVFSKPFRMPDFFLVSGLFLSRVIARDWRSYADKRVVHFLYFYLLWLLIQSLFRVTQVSGGTWIGFLEHLAFSLVEPYSTLWFIYILAVFSVVTKLLRRVPAPALLGFAALLQILPIETGSFLTDEFCERWVFFLAGYLFAPQVFRLAEAARGHAVVAVAAVAAWAVLNGWLTIMPVAARPGMMVTDLPVVGLLAGIAGAVAIVVIASLIAGRRPAEPLRHAGAQSISIYLTFFLPMAATRLILVRTGVIEDAGWVAAIVTAVAVVAPLVIERLVRHTRLSFLYRRPAWARLRSRASGLRLQPAE